MAPLSRAFWSVTDVEYEFHRRPAAELARFAMERELCCFAPTRTVNLPHSSEYNNVNSAQEGSNASQPTQQEMQRTIESDL